MALSVAEVKQFSRWVALADGSATHLVIEGRCPRCDHRILATFPIRADRISAALMEQAEIRGADLIVAGSQGVSAFGSTAFGSVSSALVHLADRPVLVVRPHEGEVGGPAFVCYDGSPESLAGDRVRRRPARRP